MIVLVLWGAALICAILETINHYRHWRRKSDFQVWLRRPDAVRVDGDRRVARNWVNNAVYHLGLRILFVVLALERVTLQLSIPVSERGEFGASPLQVGLALIFFIIVLWLVLWTRTINRYDATISREGC